MFRRSLQLPPSGTDTFFLWGPRQSGKSTLLKSLYPDGRWVDLLKNDEFRRYSGRPELLRQELDADDWDPSRQIVIDEVQKVPALLDEVHWLLENSRFSFALCGSSARKVRRGNVNLLGGRAARYELRGLTGIELGDSFDITRLLNHGYMPSMYEAQRPRRMLDAYIDDYLRHEIATEGVVRNLPAFADFLRTAAMSDGEIVNFTNIASECGVSSPTVKNHFEILDDTLLGRWLPAYRRRQKRRVIVAPKFYFYDVGIVNRLSRRGVLAPGTSTYGKAFENWVFHELSAYVSYNEIDLGLSFWRLPSGIEVDFLLGDVTFAVESKASRRVTDGDLKGLRTLIDEHPQVRQRVLVCMEARARRTPDGIYILPAETFVQRLWSDELFNLDACS